MKARALIFLLVPILIVAWLLAPRVRPMSSSDIRRIAEAPAKYSYIATGTVRTSYRGTTVVSKIRLFHEAPNMCRIEYLSPPLKGVVVGSDGKQVWRIDPAIGKEVVMESSGCINPEGRLDLLLANYRLLAASGGRTAGRPTLSIRVRDKSWKLKKRLLVDKATFVVLRSQEYEGGTLTSETAFDSIKYVDNPSSLFEKPSGMMCIQGAGNTMPVGELSKAVGFEVTQPKYIPTGYKLDGYRLYDCPCQCGHKSAYIRYTNGLSSISVFETKKDPNCTMAGSCELGSCRMGTSSRDGKSFIVLGDLSPRELSNIAKSL